MSEQSHIAASGLHCGFCQRPWDVCKADCCPERRIVLLGAKLFGCRLSPDEEAEVARAR